MRTLPHGVLVSAVLSADTAAQAHCDRRSVTARRSACRRRARSDLRVERQTVLDGQQ
jgi:hypothetical protein